MSFGMSLHRTIKYKIIILMRNGRHRKFINYTLTPSVTCRIKHFMLGLMESYENEITSKIIKYTYVSHRIVVLHVRCVVISII